MVNLVPWSLTIFCLVSVSTSHNASHEREPLTSIAPLRAFPINDLMPPFNLVNSGVADFYSKVMYGDPGTRCAVIDESSWKYWTATV
jgi:hypothetical protein